MMMTLAARMVVMMLVNNRMGQVQSICVKPDSCLLFEINDPQEQATSVSFNHGTEFNEVHVLATANL